MLQDSLKFKTTTRSSWQYFIFTAGISLYRSKGHQKGESAEVKTLPHYPNPAGYEIKK